MAKAFNIEIPKLRALLSYCPETGIFRWLQGRRRGKIAGCPHRGRYLQIKIDGHRVGAHRVGVALMTGEWPKEHVDHVSGDGLDNRWVNIRNATASENGANRGMASHNTSGYKGVCWHPQSQKWRAEIRHQGKHIHIALCDTREEARIRYLAKARELFGEFSSERN